ncbi:response regulator [Olivibacter sp. SA151]|uniref:response regulator transcription factor n=1 Tax=Olivibacter jilunii TaxID=985016 RepID=UPI003F141B64
MKKRVIVVEDDPDISELVRYILTDGDFEVTSFDCASAFWEGIVGTEPDIVLLDIMLPDGNGLEICKEMRKSERTRNIPVVMMSAHYENIDNECRFVPYVKKPFDIDDLVSKVRQSVA